MSLLVIEIPTIADLSLIIMKRVIEENENKKIIPDDESGPIAVAAALSDFYQLSSGLEQQPQQLDDETATELAHHALDLIDRLSYQLRQLDMHDQRENLARVFASLAVWFARRGAVLDNLDAVADSFARLVNGVNQPEELVELNQLMEEVLASVSETIKADEDRDNPWRPWRVLNLNAGIAATRALDTDLMEATFRKLEQRLPYDLPGFFADGKRQMDMQDVPEEVKAVMTRYADKWPGPSFQ
ncbi:MAG: hypothetical protein ACWA5Q_02770 [bacterium]